ncbi:hypothetical protein J8002_001916 [Salmonella enterica]|nr:hypothetical protein [Salmonella enterica]
MNTIPVMAENVVYVPSANGRKKKTPPDVVQRQVLEALPKLPYRVTFRGFVGEYKGIKSRVSLSCECGREFTACAKDVINKGSGCRACCIRKYEKPDSPYVYVMRSGDIGKVGVSGSLRSRLAHIRHSTKLDFEIVYKQEQPDLKTAYAKERLIKSLVCKGGYADIAEGWTETFRFNPKTLNTIKNFCV